MITQKILLLDNNLKDFIFLSSTLVGQGYQVKRIISEEQIIEKTLEISPDLLLIDSVTCDNNLYKICQCLKFDIRTQQIPIIVLLGADKLPERFKLFQLGIIDYIIKPLCYEEILVRLQAQFISKEIPKTINRSDLLIKIYQTINAPQNTQSIIETATIQIGEALGVSRAFIHIYEKNLPNPKIYTLGEYSEPDLIPMRHFDLLVQGNLHIEQILSQDQAIASSAAPKAIACNDIAVEPRLENYRDTYEQLGIKSILAVRTCYQGQPNGLICLHQCNTKRQWTQEEIELIESIAAAIGMALAQVKLPNSEAQALETNTIKLCNYNLVLTQLAKNPVLYQGDLQAVFRQITAAGAKNIGVERASIWLYDETATQIQCFTLFEKSRNQHQASEGFCLLATDYPAYFQALQQEELIAADNAHTDPRTTEFSQSYLTPFNITSMLDTPVRLAGKNIGVLCLEAVGVIHQWTLEDENFARSLGNLISLALEAREHQRAEAARRASEKKLASAFRSSPDPIFLLTFPETRYIEINDSFSQLFGYSRSQVIGYSHRELNIWISPEECAFINQVLQQTKVIRNHEIDFCTAHGEIKTALFSAEMIEIDGQEYLLGTAKDITERKQAENESRLLLLTSQAITRAVDVDSALKVVLRLICHTIGWDFSEAWIPSEDGTVLNHSLVWYADEDSLGEFYRQSQTVQFAPGVGLPGRVWQASQPEWIEDVSHVMQPTFLRSPQAAKAGLKAGFGVPILAGREVLAILVFFKRTAIALDKRLLLLVGAVAAQLGGLIQRKTLERELALREAHLNAFFSSAPVYMNIVDKQLRFVQINQLLADINGKPAHDHIGKTIDEILPEVAPLVKPLYKQVLLTGQAILHREISTALPQQPDIVRHFLMSIFPIVDEDDCPSRMGTVMVEISNLKQAEIALQEGRQRYQTLAEASPVGIYHADASGNCFYFNRRWCEITGLSYPDALGQGWEKALHPDDVQRVHSTWNQARATKSLYKCEHRFLRPDGEVVWVICQAVPELTLNQEIIGYVGTITDITDRKLAEEALRESAEREKAIAQVIQRMRQTLDLETIFTATTQELRQVLDCDRVVVYRFHPDWSGEFVSESVSNGWISLIEAQKKHPHLTDFALESDSCISQILGMQSTGLKINKSSIYSPDASFRCVPDIYKTGFDPCYINLLEHFQAQAYIIVPIFCGNQLWGLLASYQNSGPRQWKAEEINVVVQIGNQLGVALQQAQLLAQTQSQSQALQAAVIAADAANRAKSEFLANMSHELRTPLNAILGFTQVMNHDTSLSREQHQNLAIINRAGEHLLNLINDILEMSKIEAGKTTLNDGCFDLIHLLKNLEEMLRFRAVSKGLELIFEYAADIPQYVQTDESKLRQVLLNLLGNAIKFTSSGSVILRVWGDGKTQSPDSSSQFLHFEVIDTGAGISSEELDMLFAAFGQTETGRKSQQGTGLGLAISRKYVQLMGGDISVSTILGRGSTFTFNIQIGLALSEEITPQTIHRQVVGLATEQPEYRILVVDDVMESRLVIVKLLTAIGFVVREAKNGEEAIAQWIEWQPHLIFMDMRMPVMDGYAATKVIKNRNIGHDQENLSSIETIIIALTAHAFAEQKEAIMKAGCDDLLNKPFREEQVLEKICQYLGVKYIYQADSDLLLGGSLQTPENTVTNDDLLPLISQMSPEWVAQIYNAAAQCSDDLIVQLMEQIPEENSLLNQYLTDLAHNFQFEKIMEIMNLVDMN
ncbi:GAF domain-containing protein [Nostoc sp. CCY0012]|uniref:GAF domain-containing protein n=1 Tax=Nostoc sp. CCY0012 TaxID=1056123 RepID=UPI0039C634DE